MLRIILIGTLGAAVAYCVVRLLRCPTGNWREIGKCLIPLLALLLLLFIATGKGHLLGIMLAGLIPILRNIGPLLLQFGPKLYQQQRQQQQDQSGPHAQPPANHQKNMSKSEALAILGLEEGASKEQIKQAHRRLMQKIHPDHGGSDYLAAQLNRAKEVLLKTAA